MKGIRKNLNSPGKLAFFAFKVEFRSRRVSRRQPGRRMWRRLGTFALASADAGTESQAGTRVVVEVEAERGQHWVGGTTGMRRTGRRSMTGMMRVMTFRRTPLSPRRTPRGILRVIRRMNNPRLQIRALLAKRHAYKSDGPGVVYITSRLPYSIWNAYLQGHIQSSDLLDALEVKVGHTSNISRRQMEYRVCASGIAIRWHVAFRARKRILSEAIAHLLLRDMGAVPLVYPCPGCTVSHREYIPLRSVGSLNALVRLVRYAIRETGQLVVPE
ncbi:hypothetical protein B0H11DRAFT_1920960 [Mycena galericulata]|nr:hypothetical protein B0H11DRAFT_1920960 [Mycena galericulata]